MALAGRIDKAAWRVYVMTGDGELGEGQVWEAATAAGHYRLSKLRAIVDANGFSAMGRIRERYDVGDPEAIAAKFSAFGWRSVVINGHAVAAVAAALDAAAEEADRPSAIVCRTVKGKGVSFAENTHLYHSKAMDENTRSQALAEINA
jgi:transketolase